MNREATTYNDDYRGNSIFKQRLTVRNIANYLSSQDKELRYAYYISCVLFYIFNTHNCKVLFNIICSNKPSFAQRYSATIETYIIIKHILKIL